MTSVTAVVKGSSKLWPALEIQLSAADSDLFDLVLAQLDDFQPTALLERDCRTFHAFFSTSSDRDSASEVLNAGFAGRGVSTRRLDVDDENWAARSQAELRAVEVGRFIVAPPWDVPNTPHLLTIVIEPSMGFGTGHHASTRLCLDALQRIDVRGLRVLDVGTGSGVLAIAAALSGAAHVLALDIDADALQAARENAARNAAANIQFEQWDFREADIPSSNLVFANLTGAILQRTFDRLLERAVREGLLVLSGFTQEELVGRADGPIATSSRVTIVEQLDEEGWRCLVLKRRNEE